MNKIFRIILLFFPFLILPLFFLQPTATSAAPESANQIPLSQPPRLQLPIPSAPQFSNLEFEGPEEQRYLLIPWIAQYIGAIYRYALSLVGIVVVTVIVYGGMRWLTAAGDPGKITEAKKIINNAVIGLLLTMGIALILNVINPEILRFRSLKVAFTKRAPDIEIGDFEGSNTPSDVTVGSGGNTNPGGPCAHYTADVRSSGVRCQTGVAPLPSPTGRPFGCNYHTVPGDLDIAAQYGTKPVLEVHELDMGGNYGDPIKAPISGKIYFTVRTAESCIQGSYGSCAGGTVLDVKFGSNIAYHMAHTIPEPTLHNGDDVTAGQIIARVGGLCCREYGDLSTPLGQEWKRKTNAPRHGRTDFFWSSVCDDAPPQCSPPWLVGNSLGPHTHVSIKKNGSDIPILPCMKGVGIEPETDATPDALPGGSHAF